MSHLHLTDANLELALVAADYSASPRERGCALRLLARRLEV